MLTRKQMAPYIGECLGTFFVAFSAGCVDATGAAAFKPTTHGFAVVASMYAFGAISGGHLSPAISISFGLTRNMVWTKVWAYVVMQFIGGLLGALATSALLHHSFQMGPHGGYDLWDSLVVEVIYSGILCFVALNVMASRRVSPAESNQFFGIAVGFVYVASGHVAREVCGAWLNPALTFGYGVVWSMHEPTQLYTCLLYLAYQAAGAVVAAVLFFMVRPEELNLEESVSKVQQAWSSLSFCGWRREGSTESAHGHSQEEAQEAQESRVQATYEAPWPSQVLSEFLGTYVIAFTFTLARVLKEHDQISNVMSSLDNYTVIWATGAAWLSMAYALGNISAQLSPAVTLAIMMRGGSLPLGLTFITAQCAGGIAAGVTCVLIRRGGSLIVNPERVSDLGPQALGWPVLAVGEVVFTMASCLVFLCIATVKSERYTKAPNVNSFEFGIANAFSFGAGGIAMQGMSCLNPALALAVTSSNFISSGFLVGSRAAMLMNYALLEVLGAVLASLLFVYSHPKEFTKDPLMVGCGE